MKNKDSPWYPYAAPVAAAYARWLLRDVLCDRIISLMEEAYRQGRSAGEQGEHNNPRSADMTGR